MRPATERDIDTIAQMETACFTDPWSRSAFSSLLGHRHVLFLVADWYTAGPEPDVATCAPPSSTSSRATR